MMGEFHGNAGLLSAWWDAGEQAWKFEYDACMAGVQHIWWAVHVVDLVVVALAVACAAALLWEDWCRGRDGSAAGREEVQGEVERERERERKKRA